VQRVLPLDDIHASILELCQGRGLPVA
jgi:hypothetical protein